MTEGPGTESWATARAAPRLQGGEVHLWRGVLGVERKEDALLLSSDECERVERLRNLDGRRRFLARRAFLRRVLGLYTGSAPQALSFEYGEVGKPMLDSARFPDTVQPVRFRGLVRRGCQPWRCHRSRHRGGDSAFGMDVVAREVFTDREQTELNAFIEEDRLLAFLTGWTRKEAIVKALGDGLALSLKSIEVSLSRESEAALVRLGESSVASWSLESFGLAPGVLGAVAVERSEVELRRFQLSLA